MIAGIFSDGVVIWVPTVAVDVEVDMDFQDDVVGFVFQT